MVSLALSVIACVFLAYAGLFALGLLFRLLGAFLSVFNFDKS